MAKHMNCQTVICKVKGITILNINNNNITPEDHYYDNNGLNQRQQQSTDSNDSNDIESQDMNIANEEQLEIQASDEEYETMNEELSEGKGVFEMEKVENGIESVRQYVLTTRKFGKVWHLCQWHRGGQTCAYGTKWSGAMVNHIRSHLGVKPFRCTYCRKLFTIACNLKNHLRIHHGLRAKIVSNGGRRRRDGSQSDNDVEDVVIEESRNAHSLGGSSKLRIFKPSFINGKVANNPYAPQTTRRYGPKRKFKRNQRYVDYEEELDDIEDNEEEEEDNEMNEEEAEEENKRFYENTKSEELDDNEDEELSQLIIKRRYNKKLWFVCIWNPRQCKYRSHVRHEVLNHLKKHQNIRSFVCNWNHCSASFADKQQLTEHQVIHKSQKFFKCHFPKCMFTTINDKAFQMHKIRHRRNR